MTPSRRGHAACCSRSATPPSPTKSARDWSGSASTRARARSSTATFWRRLRTLLASDVDWHAPEPDDAPRRRRGLGRDNARERGFEPLVEHHVRRDLEPFLNAMRRRLDRDRGRIHEYHDDLRRTAQMKLAALASASGEKAEADRKRETMRVAAIEREYAAKLDDLRHNYALRVTVDWMQGLTLFAPVHRYDVLIKTTQGRTDRPHRLASGHSHDRAAALRLGTGDRARTSGLRRSSASHRPERAGSLPFLRQGLVPRLPLRPPAHAAGGRSDCAAMLQGEGDRAASRRSIISKVAIGCRSFSLTTLMRPSHPVRVMPQIETDRPKRGRSVAINVVIYSARFIFVNGPECVSVVGWPLP